MAKVKFLKKGLSLNVEASTSTCCQKDMQIATINTSSKYNSLKSRSNFKVIDFGARNSNENMKALFLLLHKLWPREKFFINKSTLKGHN